MTPAILGTKIGMTRVPDERGQVHPVTIIKAGPCVVLQVRTVATDGYHAIQVGYGDQKPHRSTLPMIGHAANAGVSPKRWVREVRLGEPSEVSAGEVLTVAQFEGGAVNHVDVSGVTKGRGFAGAIKRHRFHRQPKTHGQTDRVRAPGAIGACTWPGRVWKGKKMPGHMGNSRSTSQNIEVVLADAERNLLLVMGSVPGPNGAIVLVQDARKQ